MNVNVPIIQNRRATQQYQAQWRLRGGVLGIPPQLDLITEDRTPTRAFQGLYFSAFEETLPVHEPVCNSDGTPSKEHLQRWP